MQKDDVIYRQAAIDALNKRWGTCILGDDIADGCAKVLSALSSAQQWIPCTPETMPETDGRYVCTYIHDGKKDVFMFRYEDGGWIVPWYVKAITAWYKPLDPWEGEEGD